MCCSLFFLFLTTEKLLYSVSPFLFACQTQESAFLPSFLTHVYVGYIYRHLRCIKVLASRASDIKKKDIERLDFCRAGTKCYVHAWYFVSWKNMASIFIYRANFFFRLCESFRLFLPSRKRRSCHCTNFLIGLKSWIEFHGNQFDVEYRCLD